MGVTFGSLEIQERFFQYRAQQFLAIAIGGGRRGPDPTNIGAENLNMLELLWAERAGPLLLPAAQFRFGRGQIAKPVLPFRFQAAGHESILGVHGSVAAFGAFGFVPRTFHLQTPLRQSRVVVGLELFDSEPHRLYGGRCDRFEKGIGHGLLDRQTADVEAVYAASIDQIFA